MSSLQDSKRPPRQEREMVEKEKKAKKKHV
jgi:hypothetical protein